MTIPSGGISMRRRGTARLVNRSSAGPVDGTEGAPRVGTGLAKRRTDQSRQRNAGIFEADGAQPVIVFIARAIRCSIQASSQATINLFVGACRSRLSFRKGFAIPSGR